MPALPTQTLPCEFPFELLELRTRQPRLDVALTLASTENPKAMLLTIAKIRRLLKRGGEQC
jgi:hypothetical protein